MKKELWTITEIVDYFQVDEHFLIDLEDEEILCPTCQGNSSIKMYPEGELEKLRLAKILIEDMGVNMAGVDVIIRMRENMFEMRRQFDIILEELAGQIRSAVERDER
ncbi:MAG: hypothetical protein JW882_12075 [Deltaproteobacteria bacterium]|nr:hypothetical protein [Deltaproteobacteria bacterium]